MKSRGYFYGGFTTSLNILLYALSLGLFLWLEGRVRHGVFRNWLRRFRYRPQKFARPRTEQELIDLIKNSNGIRFFGSGHSFNEDGVADVPLVSLDDYTGIVNIDDVNLRRTVRAGTRVRDVVPLLFEKKGGWWV